MVVDPTVVVKTELPEVPTARISEVVIAEDEAEAGVAVALSPAAPEEAGMVVAGVGKLPVT